MTNQPSAVAFKKNDSKRPAETLKRNRLTTNVKTFSPMRLANRSWAIMRLTNEARNRSGTIATIWR